MLFRSTAFAAAILVASSTHVASAQTLSQYNVSSCFGLSYGTTQPTSDNCGNGAPGGDAASGSYAKAQYGTLVTSGSENASEDAGAPTNYNYSAGTSGTAKFTDTLTITSPGQSGAGVLNFDIFFNPSTSASANGPGVVSTSSASYTLDINGLSFQSAVTSSGSNLNGAAGVSSLVGFDAYSVPFTFGQTFAFSLELDTSAFTSNVTRGTSGRGSAGGTLEWAGIQSVTAGNQAVIYSTTSASYTNYSQSFAPAMPVPEPASYALLGVGLSFIAAVVGARKKRGRVG